jgi:hypothetical protein
MPRRAALASALLACGSALDGLGPGRSEHAELPPAELDGVLFEGYRGELRDLFVTSEHATVDMVGRVARLSGVRLTLAEPTRGPIEVAAPTGQFQLDDDDFLLSGGVQGTAAKGERPLPRLAAVVAAKRSSSAASGDARRDTFQLRADGRDRPADAAAAPGRQGSRRR